LSSIAFNPENSNLIAGGTVNGEVYVWKINTSTKKEEEKSQIIKKSLSDEYFHREPVLGIKWFVENFTSNLATISSEGKILVWPNVDKQNVAADQKDLMYPIKGHIFSSQ
jgi:WD40 repeat protein